MREHSYFVYILANTFHRLYTGITSDLPGRLREHKSNLHPNAFTSRYHIEKLVHYEEFANVNAAIAREKQIKGWLRVKKIALIVEHNPTWADLSEQWGKPTKPFAEEDLKPPTTF